MYIPPTAQPYLNGYGEKHDKLLYSADKFMDGGVKTAIHILNQVPSKSMLKTPYELWTGNEPSLNYLRMWGCPTEAKVFNPNIGKLDSKIVSCHFHWLFRKVKRLSLLLS